LDKKIKKVWNREEINSVEFFRLNMIDNNNFNIGSIHIVDQLYNNYRFNMWI